MRIHTNGNADTLREALKAAQEAGKVPGHVYFDRFTPHRSTTHQSAYEVHLGTDHKVPGDGRRAPMHSSYEFASYAATYDEWGWFLAALFDRDPEAKVVGAYKGQGDFHATTRCAFA